MLSEAEVEHQPQGSEELEGRGRSLHLSMHCTDLGPQRQLTKMCEDYPENSGRFTMIQSLSPPGEAKRSRGPSDLPGLSSSRTILHMSLWETHT